VDRAGIDQLGKTQLPDVAHALHERMLDQVEYLFTLHRDKAVDGIVYDFIFVQHG
jgi:hypothetical protein